MITRRTSRMTIKTEDGNFVGHQTRLQTGFQAPDFEVKDQHNQTVRLSDFLGRTLVLYFYPKDSSPTCTTQACNLRDEFGQLPADVSLVGVSADSVASHLKFIQKYGLPYPLLSDPDRVMISAYDVWGTKQVFGRILDGIVRTSFVIGPDGVIKHIIRAVESKRHMQQILDLIA